MKNGKNLKHLSLSTYDIKGGAAASAYRLHRALIESGIDSNMLVQFKHSSDSEIIGPETIYDKMMGKIRARLDRQCLRFYKHYKNDPWSISWFPHNIIKRIESIKPDIVHLNWIGEGYIPIRELGLIRKPIVWTMHDMWPFTGGCHYSYDCNKYEQSCGSCPQLGSSKKDISYKIWSRKNKYWGNLDLTLVSPSRWLANCASRSSLFRDLRIEVIPYVIDLNIFKPVQKDIARYILNLPQDKLIILFGGLDATNDKRKGFQFLVPAIKAILMGRTKKDIELCVFGVSKSNQDQEIECKINYMGVVKDYVTLALIYSAADIFVAPSMQDNLPNTVIESLSCGTPVVAFNIGGNPDMIDHKINGYLVQPYDIKEMEHGIEWCLENKIKGESLSIKAREKAVDTFNREIVIGKYQKLFQGLIRNDKKN